jgi:Glycosyl transferases group 1
MKRQPNILFCTHTSPNYMPVAELSSRQIVAGPDMPNKKSGMGRIMSIQTEPTFDVAALITGLPPDQKPELVVVLRDAFMWFMPTNLQGVSCRKLLYIADSHHGSMPLCSLFDYMAREKFDRYAIAHTPHHYHWFQEAGATPLTVQLNLNARDYVKPSFTSNRQTGIYFVGQLTKWHAWRKKLVDRIVAQNIPFKMEAVLAQQAAQNYARHQLCLNTSNGDWNMRFFEVLSGGGCLLTDRISQTSGYEDYFKDGEDLIVYDNEEDLVEKANYYLARPDLCLSIARSGHAKYKQHFSENIRKQRFLEYAFSTDEEASRQAGQSTSLDPRSTSVTPDKPQLLPSRVLAYEHIQDLQRTDSIDHVVLSPQTPQLFAEDMSDLMRVKISHDVINPERTCLILQSEEVNHVIANAEQQKPQYIFVLPGTELGDELKQSLATYGYGKSKDAVFSHSGFMALQGE